MPAHIETHEIRVFKTVYEENGFKKAADKLFVTQSAVSQTISNLEKKLDTLLIERNPLKLTESGIRLLNYAETVLNEEQNVLSDINNIKNGILSTLLLAMNATVNALYAKDLVCQYCTESPLTRLKINVMPSRQLISAVGSDLWELGFGPFQREMPEYLEPIPLYTDERVLVLSRAHPDFDRLSGQPEQLVKEIPLIVSHLDDPDMRPAIDKLRDSFGTIWEVSDMSLRISLVADGLGMSYLDKRLIEAHAACTEFAILDSLPFARLPLSFGLYHRRKKELSMGARRFIELCKSHDFKQQRLAASR